MVFIILKVDDINLVIFRNAYESNDIIFLYIYVGNLPIGYFI